MTSTISVTADHIARGYRQDAERCAIALALRDIFPDAEYICVSGDGITLQPCTDDIDMDEAEITPPPEVAAFVEAFDNFADVEPFTFELDYPAAAS